MERRPLRGPGLSADATTLDGLLAAAGVAVPVRHAVSRIVSGPASAVQQTALPDAVAGRDVLAVAPTGSGKTLVFAVALAHRLSGGASLPGHPRSLVVAPTRELAEQTAEVLADVCAGTGLRVATFVGGVPTARDRRALVAPVDIAVGTPGRLLDLVRGRVLATTAVSVLVLDEADQLTGPSFGEQTAALADGCRGAGLVATTATADHSLTDLLGRGRPDLVVHRVRSDVSEPTPATADVDGPPTRLVVVSTPDPEAFGVTLAARCRRALFFVPRRDAVETLRAAVAASGVTAAGLTGAASPTRRSAALAELASGAVRVLVTTDLAARGLDIDSVGHVVHLGPPHSVEDLVHRSGRTGRGLAAAGTVAAVVPAHQVEKVTAQARAAGMAVELLDATGRVPAERMTALFGAEIATPRRRRQPAPPPRTRRPARSRPHRPKRKKGS